MWWSFAPSVTQILLDRESISWEQCWKGLKNQVNDSCGKYQRNQRLLQKKIEEGNRGIEQKTSAVSWKTPCFSPIPAIPIESKRWNLHWGYDRLVYFKDRNNAEHMHSYMISWCRGRVSTVCYVLWTPPHCWIPVTAAKPETIHHIHTSQT